MKIAEKVQAPSWVSRGEIGGGLDLLGLRSPVQFIGGKLLDGVTTVTPSVRYLTIRAWLIWRYGQTGLPDDLQRFIKFAAYIESAIVLGNLTQDRTIGGLIGTEQALSRLDADGVRVEISALVQSPASIIYAAPSDQLGITQTRAGSTPMLSFDRGLPLAKIFDRTLSSNPLMSRLLSSNVGADATVNDLFELGAIVRIDQIPDDERDLLVNAIMAQDLLNRDRPRLATYTALLALASELKARPTERDLFETACSNARFNEPCLDRIADGWVIYCIRDAIAVTQEAVLAAVMDEVLASPDSATAGVDQSIVIVGLIERVEEHNACLRDLGLLQDDESVTSLSFRDLKSRVERLLSNDRTESNGICRWSGTLTESTLYARAQSAGAGALTLSVVALLMADQRTIERGVASSKEQLWLSYQGWSRMGLSDCILPALERYYREDRSLLEVAADLAYRTVQQHLLISWSRLQRDIRRDVALLTAEDQKWFSRQQGFRGGRTASRIHQALRWLEQLSLIDDAGITSQGEIVLRRALNSLSKDVDI